MEHVIIIGGGAAGMMAAVAAAGRGLSVELLEKNEKLGKKIYITGKGRCNLTNACEMEELFEGICTNKKFLYSAFYGFTNQDTIDFFESRRMKTKTERGNRVFPVSDRASDVIGALAREMDRLNVKVCLRTEVKELLIEEGRAAGVVLADGQIRRGDAVLVATGGLSYPSTGSTGDGYRFAKAAGHRVTELIPSLVPMNVKEDWPKQMQGLSLKNVSLRLMDGKKCLYEDFGEMMFTHFGITGPLVLSASSQAAKTIRDKQVTALINLKPALTKEQLDARLLREFEANQNRQFKNALGALLPAKLIPVIIARSGIPEDKPVNRISREERWQLRDLMQEFSLTVTGLREFKEAIITKGGVAVREIDPGTMESKKLPGLYFAGEVLDLDGVTGGYNLQIAWSTGYAAGSYMGKREE